MSEERDREPELLDLDAPDDAPPRRSRALPARLRRAGDGLLSSEALGGAGILGAAVALALAFRTSSSDTFLVGGLTLVDAVLDSARSDHERLVTHQLAAGAVAVVLGVAGLLRLPEVTGAAARALAGTSTLLGAGLLALGAWTASAGPVVPQSLEPGAGMPHRSELVLPPPPSDGR